MFVVILFIFLGIGIGLNPDMKNDIKSLSPRLALLPLVTIALLANIIREMITLLLTPLIAKRFGPLAPISSGGATTMDTTLPIITQSVGQRYVALSIYHGFVTDFTVPFLVTMWCTI